MSNKEQPTELKICTVCGEQCGYRCVITGTHIVPPDWYCNKCEGYPATMDGKPIILKYS